MNLLVEPLCRGIGLVEAPGILDALAVLFDAHGSPLDGMAFTVAVFTQPFGQAGSFLQEFSIVGHIVELVEGIMSQLKVRP